jgi:hypothetical protein
VEEEEEKEEEEEEEEEEWDDNASMTNDFTCPDTSIVIQDVKCRLLTACDDPECYSRFPYGHELED